MSEAKGGAEQDAARTASTDSSTEQYVNPYADDHFSPYLPAVAGEEDAPMELSDDESTGSEGGGEAKDGGMAEGGEEGLRADGALKGTREATIATCNGGRGLGLGLGLGLCDSSLRALAACVRRDATSLGPISVDPTGRSSHGLTPTG